MKSKYNNIKLGLILGIAGPILAMIGVYLVMFLGLSLSEVVDALVSKRIFTKLISLCVLPNLALFFLFLNKYYYNTARGILMSTFIFALFIFITKFAF
jgi:hypothetical protein